MPRDDRLLSSAIEAIGCTPLVELSRLAAGTGGRLLAKLEFLNPGFSKKDRIARQIIEDAESTGDLKPGQAVVELTSGNTGTGLAIVCAVKGYPFVAVMSRGNSPERARMMAALGAEVVLVDQMPGSPPGQVSGEDLALRIGRTSNWQELTLNRAVPRAGPMTATFVLCGLGEVRVDDVRIHVLEPANVAPSAAATAAPAAVGGVSRLPSTGPLR